MNLKKKNTVSTANDTSATNGRDNSGKQKESLLPTTDFERLGDSVRGDFSFGNGISPARNSISRRRKSNIAPNNNFVYYWPDEEIALAEEISKESQRFIFGYLERPPRSDTRTSTDNRIDMAAYLNNQETWKIVSSKLMFFMASVMAMLAMLTVYLASYASSGEEMSLTVREHISREGSLSSMWREQAAANRLNQAFMVCSSLLMFLSNFGFYLLPRWENEQTFAKHDDKKGWCFFQCLQNLVCFNSYKRVEATSNWVVGEEGTSFSATLLTRAACALLFVDERNLSLLLISWIVFAIEILNNRIVQAHLADYLSNLNAHIGNGPAPGSNLGKPRDPEDCPYDLWNGDIYDLLYLRTLSTDSRRTYVCKVNGGNPNRSFCLYCVLCRLHIRLSWNQRLP